MNPKLKKIIFNKLYKDLSHVEIILHKDSVWFIDRKEKYWYFEYNKNGTLYWRWQYFIDFFKLFSFGKDDFEPIVSEWVEEVLNCKVITPNFTIFNFYSQVEEVLNCKVVKPQEEGMMLEGTVGEVLNCKVVTPTTQIYSVQHLVEKVLNCKVDRTIIGFMVLEGLLEEVLNSI